MKLDGAELKKILKNAAKEGGRAQLNAETDDVKKEWFKFILESINKLEERVKELENHECKCAGNKGTSIQS